MTPAQEAQKQRRAEAFTKMRGSDLYKLCRWDRPAEPTLRKFWDGGFRGLSYEASEGQKGTFGAPSHVAWLAGRDFGEDTNEVAVVMEFRQWRAVMACVQANRKKRIREATAKPFTPEPGHVNMAEVMIVILDGAIQRINSVVPPQ